MKDLIALLKGNQAISGYRVASVARKTYELFFVHRKLETVRATDTVDTNVTVYADHDDKVGDSTFAVYGSMTADEISAKINEAADRARLVFNQPYELPEGGVESEELESNMKDEEPAALAAKIADAVFAADCTPGGSINATEIFLYREAVRVINSRGIDKTQIKHRVMIEAIPTFTEGSDSVELYEAYRFTEFDPARVTAEIAAKMREVEQRRHAVKPETPMTANVVLRDKEIAELLSSLAGDLNYAGVYSQSNLHHKGDVLQNGDGDRLELSMVGKIRGSGSSAFFDDDGVSLTDTTLISDGKVVAYYGSHRFASYLGEPETGNLGCMKLGSGTLTATELEAAPYIECVSLSGLQVDLYNDYIGGEVRLAYLHEGGNVTPLTGITMSAKLSDVLGAVRLSDDTVVSERYTGPSKLLMRDVKIM